MSRRVLITLLVVSVLALAAGAVARAGYQDDHLNTVASSVAGHQVTASCAASTPEWAAWLATAYPGAQGFDADGFTYVGREPVIYLAPRICSTLLALLGPNHDDVGPYWASLAIKTILHESIHQRGYTDEGLTDCTALTLVTQYAVSSFGYPALVSKSVIAYKFVKGKRTPYVKTVQVANPALARLAADALYWHRLLPANYQGGC